MARRERAREPTERSPLFAADTREVVCLSVATRGIRIGNRHPMTETLYLNPSEVDGCSHRSANRPVRYVLVGVLTGMRIGEILAFRWKHLDLLRGNNPGPANRIRRTVWKFKYAEQPAGRSNERSSAKGI